MDKTLLVRRQQVADRHDAALARFPARQGTEFEREMRAVVQELSAIAKAADVPASDPVERARTLTWLGSAYFDLGRGVDEALLFDSARCYLEAERIVQAEEAPLFKAKLNFNFANTLRGQSGGGDVALLEAAEHRYEVAAEAFGRLGQADLRRQAQSYLTTLQAQLALAREHSKIGRELKALEGLAQQVPEADVLERDKIQAQLEAIKGRSKASLVARLGDAFAEMNKLREDHPELLGPLDESVLAELAGNVERLASETRNRPETSRCAW